ncbi:ABC transporter ATP-binding protein [Gammaproteobacteria bacterium]|nr:ABC transporter ATP-binding protein [Gammaproteobacteria bacterium]
MAVVLKIENINSFYGSIQALFGMGLECEEGKLTTLLGRNGMGKTTTVKSIIGKVSVTHGEIYFRGESIIGMPTYDIIRKGIGLVPEGRHIFPNLSVKENLVATANKNSGLATEWTVDQVVEFFPALGDRLNHMGDQLSGGEQQMLAIGRALMLNPQMLILDEATEGLAPLVRQEIWNRLVEIKQLGITILLIDKNIDEFIDISDFHYIIEKGRQVWAGSSRELVDDSGLKARYLGI